MFEQKLFKFVALGVSNLFLRGEVVFDEEAAHFVVAPGVPDLIVGSVKVRLH